MNGDERIEMVTRAFQQCYGDAPSVWVRAPGRVDLMGSHTDYNQGHVLTMTIDRDTWIAARSRQDDQVQIASMNLEGSASFSLQHITHDRAVPWTDYVRGVASTLQTAGLPLHGFDGLVHSTIPFRSGLSSSAALEAAAATLFSILGDWRVAPERLALLCQSAENRFVGVNCGILDQYSSVMGQAGYAVLLDCRALTSRAVSLPAGIVIAICDTQSRRQLSGSEYAERRAQCDAGVAILRRRCAAVNALRDVSLSDLLACADDLPATTLRRCRFIVEEEARVLALAAALERSEQPAMAVLMSASYDGARDLYRIGTGHMEAMILAMRGAPGVLGARQAGAGFGGCMVAAVAAEHVGAFINHVERAYHDATGVQPRVFPVQPSPGAGLVPCM